MATSPKKMVYGMIDRAKTFDALKNVFLLYVSEEEISENPMHVSVVDGKKKAEGEETFVCYPSGKDSGKYEIWELDDVIPSHNVRHNFQVNPAYPEGVQERHYEKDVNEQLKVKNNARRLDAAYVINSNPDAVNGPPIVTKSGVVLGGNSRTMSIATVYDEMPEKAEEYRKGLRERAAQFGFTEGDVEAFKQPILVRVIDTEYSNSDMAKMSHFYNQNLTQQMDEIAQGVSKANLVTMDTLKLFTNAMASEKYSSMRDYLSSRDSGGLIAALQADGVIEESQLSYLYNRKTGRLTEPGKRLVEAVFRGVAIDDYDLLTTVMPSYLQKIDKSLAALAQVKARGGKWDITDKLKRALRLVIQFTESVGSKGDPEMWLRESTFYEQDNADRSDQQVADIFRLFIYGTQNSVADAWEKYAAAALQFREGEQGFPGLPMPSAKKKSHEILGGAADIMRENAKKKKKDVVSESAKSIQQQVFEECFSMFPWNMQTGIYEKAADETPQWKLDLRKATNLDEIKGVLDALFGVIGDKSRTIYDRLIDGEFYDRQPIPFLTILGKAFKEKNRDLNSIKPPCKKWVDLHEDWIL